jgi:hypothetical protein
MPRRVQIDPRGGVAVQPRQAILDEHASRALNISVVERRSERRLILQGKLLAPWVAELRTACAKGQCGRSKPRDRPEELNGHQPGRRRRGG